jgi:hypothetical protein
VSAPGSIRQIPSVVAFHDAAEAFCRILEEQRSAPEGWGERILQSLSQLYACGHVLAECGLDEGAPDLPDEFDVTNDQCLVITARLADYFGAQDFYWYALEPSEIRPSKQECGQGMFSSDFAEIYQDVAPGIRAWQAQREDLLQTIVFDWKIPLFKTHWGRHAAEVMLPPHDLVYLHGIRSEA